MSVVFDIKIDVEEVKKWAGDMRANRVNAAASRAINKTLTNVRTESSKQIRKERALKASVVRDALAISRANKTKLEGALIASGKPIPLREYDARKTRQGVTVRVTPGARKLVVFSGNKAFELDRFGGHVYARTGKKRLPIKKLYGPSIPATFLKEKIVQAMQATAGEQWQKNFNNELNFELSK